MYSILFSISGSVTFTAMSFLAYLSKSSMAASFFAIGGGTFLSLSIIALISYIHKQGVQEGLNEAYKNAYNDPSTDYTHTPVSYDKDTLMVNGRPSIDGR